MASVSAIMKQLNIKHEELKTLLHEVAQHYEISEELEYLKNVRRVARQPELTRLWETQALIEIVRKLLPENNETQEESNTELVEDETIESEAIEPDESDQEQELVEEKPSKRKRG